MIMIIRAYALFSFIFYSSFITVSLLHRLLSSLMIKLCLFFYYFSLRRCLYHTMIMIIRAYALFSFIFYSSFITVSLLHRLLSSLMIKVRL
ncbi:hypothetical protein F2Q70_00039075 [Brassica cretica]|uniref:Uncharacterized protein n=1 Tax=Brassica cretica TaxID=69181 RepID=A0A8S9K2K7_BRACR|nr:hypothetical protein F2Q70_00039075 [Brassica cretica]